MAQKTLLTCLGTCALFAIYVAAQGSIDVVVVGNLSRTQHRVSGNVSKSTNIFNFAINKIRGHPPLNTSQKFPSAKFWDLCLPPLFNITLAQSNSAINTFWLPPLCGRHMCEWPQVGTRGHAQMTSAKFSGFLTPSLPWSVFVILPGTPLVFLTSYLDAPPPSLMKWCIQSGVGV